MQSIQTEHAVYAADAILDYPQSGERFQGRSTIAAQRGGYPADRHFTVLRIVGGGKLWVSECVITYDGVPSYSVSIMQFADEHVAHETPYFADPFRAPASRAALAEPMPGRTIARDDPAGHAEEHGRCRRAVNHQRPSRVLRDTASNETCEETLMIIWHGWGILALPLFALGSLGGTALGLAMGLGTGDLATGASSNAGTVAGLLAAAIATWIVGRRLNRPRPGFDRRTGRPVTLANRHRLMLIPLQYVGICGGLLALVVAGRLVAAG